MNKKPNNHKRTALANLIGIAVTSALLCGCTTPTTLQLARAKQDLDNLSWMLQQVNVENVQLEKEIAQLKRGKGKLLGDANRLRLVSSLPNIDRRRAGS